MAGEEPDGKDEAMVPTDYPTAGLLTDNELNQTMLKSHKVRDAANLPAPTAFLPILKQCPGSGPERLRNDHLHGLLPLCLHPRHPLCARDRTGRAQIRRGQVDRRHLRRFGCGGRQGGVRNGRRRRLHARLHRGGQEAGQGGAACRGGARPSPRAPHSYSPPTARRAALPPRADLAGDAAVRQGATCPSARTPSLSPPRQISAHFGS